MFWSVKYIVVIRDIAKIENPQIFVLSENEASYEDFFCPKVS